MPRFHKVHCLLPGSLLGLGKHHSINSGILKGELYAYRISVYLSKKDKLKYCPENSLSSMATVDGKLVQT
uniref:Uncharacterized protein n=1 Tax=Anguilla anguilla TaxID=7936 RepID=A0A0E9XPB7_ANGAN